MHVWALLAQAWVFYPGQVDIPNRFAWSQPADFSDDAGLGGITYALDPALCSTILRQFKEEAAESMLSFSNFGVTFVDCTEDHRRLHARVRDVGVQPPRAPLCRCVGGVHR